ncbi:transporter substrate-binding domain-containing protein [Alicyclobacillus pomorum]|uniref:transporter substrate-binding domain-containing protein n=1 Tax=Alicyclobacillus pomorum TaxID=204470 RepID=UPI00040724BB|nr:transporter substrate-binding domain-containing protein [Alicyclobacillus pomorum]
MKKTAWISTMATSVALMSVLTGCGAPSSDNRTSSTGATPSAGGPTLVLATSADYKPYEFHDTSSGQDKIVGFDMDVANAIAKQLHFNIKVEDMDFDGLIGALQSGRADFVIAGMTPTAERKKSVDFSDVYYQATNIVLTKKGHAVKSLDDLKGETVAAQLGSVQETAAKAIPGVKVESLNTIPNVVQEVVTNRAQAAVIEDTVAKGYVQNNPSLQINEIPGVKSNGSAIAFPKGSKWVSKFNTAIEKMKQDGELQQLADKWFSGQK